MNIFTSIFLGTIQGLTEFIPVSSSGHLVFFQKLIPGFYQPGILFDVILHFGTLTAVLFFFRKRLFKIDARYLLLLFIGTIPAVFFGFLFQEQFENMFSGAKFLAFEFLITGLINFLLDFTKDRKNALNPTNSFLIGIAQAIAIIPGISRSGATIFTGTSLGINRQKVAEYSFLLSVPAIFGANILQIFTHTEDLVGVPWNFYLAGFIAAFISGFASIGIVINFLKNNKFKYFGVYCLLIAILTFLFI